MHQLSLSYLALGYKVFGYDLKSNEYTKICAEKGVQISHRFNKEFLHVDLCVRTGAIKDDNKYVVQLKKLGVKVVDRAEALGELCGEFGCVIAVAGTHGKSTTSSLIYEILRASGKKVSCHIGADVFSPRFNLGDDFLVVEACEYNKSFLKLNPNISVVTNVEAEHMDCYGSLFKLKSAFLTFLKRGEKRFVFKEKSTKFLSKAQNVNLVELGGLIETKLKGEYNQKNIALALAVCKSLNIDEKVARKVVKNFGGVPRRYELVGAVNKTKVYIDYAHHPTEIEAFTHTFLNENKNAFIVFQPHTYSRTKNFLSDFVKVFAKIKNLVIFKEYPAREKRSCGLSAHDLYLAVKAVNPHVKYASSSKKVVQHMAEFDAVAFVGAGDIDLIAKKIVKSY